MPQSIRFALALHNHQPIGNFADIFERAYQESYRPFLEVFSRYDTLKISLHTSGPLMEWLAEHHPGYVDRLAGLAAEGRIEILGGPFYEPILAMIPRPDRLGQIESYTRWLNRRLGVDVRGMWVPERVWEQSFTRDLVDAGIDYTLLDDFHFKNAGLTDSELWGRFLTEDDGRVMSIFPGSERLRYTIPFADPQKTIDHLAGIADAHPGAVVVFGDDGEKFGTWPETHKHVYHDGWLERFFSALIDNSDWIVPTTLKEAFDNVAPAGRIYLPDSSYREMTEWVLPAEQQIAYEEVSREMDDDPRWPVLKRFVRGGFWRNFRVKYPEANEMYSRMMLVSRRLQEAIEAGAPAELVEKARTELYRGQCNCSYWHGAFGGIYLPHLRNAVYRNLIAADGFLDRAAGRSEGWVDYSRGDFNFDTRDEIQLANDKLIAWLAPFDGGRMYEFDVRSIGHNLLATLTRRREAYHRKVLAGPSSENGNCSSIHDRVVFKQEGLDQRVVYDKYARKSLIDLFYDEGETLDAVAKCDATQRGDFIDGPYNTSVKRNADRTRILLSREGMVDGKPLTITKAITLEAGCSTLEVAYRLEGLPKDRNLHFAVEFNFAGLPSGADDRFFYGADRQRLGQLGTRLDLHDIEELGLVDEWLGVDVRMNTSRPTGFWTFPVETVSQSEGGFELVHQSVVVQPHWIIHPNPEDRFDVTLELSVDTSLAGSRQNPAVAAAT